MPSASTISRFVRSNTPIGVAANGRTIATFCNEQEAVKWVHDRSPQHPDVSYSIYDLRDPKRPAMVIRHG